MVLMSAADSALSAACQQRLHQVARAALEHGVRSGTPLRVALEDHPAALHASRGCFVTLRKEGNLRGCLGSLEARAPLALEVARLAYAAAARDPRFGPVTEDELAAITVKLSVLSVPMPVAVASEAALLATLRPGVDGVIFSDGRATATFLPEVWGSFPTPQAFIDQLRVKAGLAADHWSDTVAVQRYTTQSF